MSKKYYVYDYETMKNAFVAVFEDLYTEETFVFACHKDYNNFNEYYNFLKSLKDEQAWLFGYNNLSFDSQIHEMILDSKEFSKEHNQKNSDFITSNIYTYAQDVISRSHKNIFLDYPKFKLRIPNLDIYMMNHWNSKAKMSSLKWIQYSMDWHNIEEMPYPHYKDITKEQLFEVINYCINDVKSTKAIINYKDRKGEEVMKSQIRLRAELSKTYGIDLHSSSEPSISKEMFLHFLSEKLKTDKKSIKSLRTYRNEIKVNDIILPGLDFIIPEFKSVLLWFNSLVVNTSLTTPPEDRDKISKTIVYKNVETVYALGGIHGCIEKGIYESTENRIIKSVDVESYYPNLAIKNKWSPEHLDKNEFCDLYEWFFKERKKYKKGHGLNYLYKIILNSTYGLSKEANSFLYDPELTFKITVNGQLLLTKLYEMISLGLPTAQPLMQNTDGLEFIIDKQDEEKFKSICKKWEEMTNLVLEECEYKKMIISDVNNYIAIYNDPKKEPKCKGRFEFNDLGLHKNKSFLVIPKGIYEYFVNNVLPEDYILTNNNIFDYCAGVKLKGDWFFVENYLNKLTGEIEKKTHKKILRYYISKSSSKILKCNPDGRVLQLEAGKWLQTVFNVYEKKNFEDYKIDKDYYLQAIKNEITKIEKTETKFKAVSEKQQLQLF